MSKMYGFGETITIVSPEVLIASCGDFTRQNRQLSCNGGRFVAYVVYEDP